MIRVSHVKKTFRVSKREAGFMNACRSFVHKQYEEIPALDDISFHIKEGEMVGYIGVNGAGKSSTIKVLSGILTPDSGSVLCNGLTPWKQRKAYVKDIGVVFGQRSQLWWDLPVIDSFNLLKDIYGVTDQNFLNNLNEISETLQLQELLKTPLRQLSLGQKMRCELAAALLHQPKILFLDEPTIGLDALSKIAIRNFLKQMNEKYHTTMILTTHDAADIEALCNRVLLIGKGKILMDGSFSDIKKQVGKENSLDEMFASFYRRFDL